MMITPIRYLPHPTPAARPRLPLRAILLVPLLLLGLIGSIDMVATPDRIAAVAPIGHPAE